MLSITLLKGYVAAYREDPPRTIKLEQHIQIGTGYHDKWYRSQREHMLGWLVVQECQARMRGQEPASVDAKGMWGRLKCSPLMFWLAEAACAPTGYLDQAEQAAMVAAQITPKDGDPHGRLMREALPWGVVMQAILAGPEPMAPMLANEHARPAFERLTTRVSAYRKHRKWAG